MMGDLSENFSRHEFTCKCGCGKDTVDYELLAILEAVRGNFKAPVTINSGNRCIQYNLRVGGSDFSQHKLSKAADITVKGIEPMAVAAYLNARYPDYYGIGTYKTFTHVDSRTGKARWDQS